MCCGSRRSAWRAASALARAPEPVRDDPVRTGGSDAMVPIQQTGVRAAFGATTLHYAGDAPIKVRGPVTGQAYEFSAVGRVQAVDARDAAVLARSNRFRAV